MPTEVTIVVATMNRRAELLANLPRLAGLGDDTRIVVVDNGSSDGTAAAVRHTFPDVTVVALPRNVGGAARTVGARLATTPYVAFADDDSWWDPGALSVATELLDRSPDLALVTASVRVEPSGGLDPVSAAQGSGPYDVRWRPTTQGRRAVSGFLACAAVVDRARYLAVGGFAEELGIGGEEELLALDLADCGMGLAYAPEAVVRHAPSPTRDPQARAARLARNHLLTAVLRHPPAEVAKRARVPASAAAATARALGWALARRRPTSPTVVGRFASL